MGYDLLKLMYHLDDLRERKGISKETICDNLCGVRQYYKYLSGKNNISDKRLNEFLHNLKISPRDFYYSFYEKDKYEHKFVKDLYYDLIHKKYKIVSKKVIDGKKKNSISNDRLFTYCESRYLYEKREITKFNYLSKLSVIADYPNCIQKEAFDFSDIVSIQSIAELEVKEGKIAALNLLLKILKNNDLVYLSSSNRDILPTIYSTVSILLGRMKRYKTCIEIAQLGVSYCRKYSLNKSLSWIFYALAIANKESEKIHEAEMYASLCMISTVIRGNTKEKESFYKLLLDDFNLSSFEVCVNNKEVYMQGTLIQ